MIEDTQTVNDHLKNSNERQEERPRTYRLMVRLVKDKETSKMRIADKI